jgi:hypothetical protein
VGVLTFRLETVGNIEVTDRISDESPDRTTSPHDTVAAATAASPAHRTRLRIRISFLLTLIGS